MTLNSRISPEELELRARLGIPKDAKTVLIFAQSTHWDPDWLLTADQYQRLFTDRTLERALKELEKDSRYIYSVECLFFFKRYWEKHPDRQNLLRDYVNEGRIKFTGTALTTPDTLLPEPENLIRDYLFGYYWLKKNGIKIDPKVAYLPDDFGHSPTLPALLRELGYRYVAFSRIDGGYFIGTDYRSAKEYPLPGSSAELLLKQLKTVDFIWRAPDGSEVIAHFNPFSYFQGETIDKRGLGMLYGIPLGFPARSEKYTNAKIDSFIKQLKPYSKTGYLFCPIGGDFNPPVPNLVKILERYNQTRYPETGVYAVLASLEDYFQLLEFHKDKLPTLNFDPNPTFMGFYASRPELKQRCRKLSHSLLVAEALGVKAILSNHSELYPELAQPWEISLFSNHHDFITGTARERVYRKEQIPLLNQAQDQVDQILEKLKIVFHLSQEKASKSGGKISWGKKGTLLEIENNFFRIEIDEKQGGAITRWYDKSINREIISGASNDIVLYYETGGLWRMGQELKGGKFQELVRASAQPAESRVEEKNGILEVIISCQLEGKNFFRHLYFRGDEPSVRMKLTGSVKKKRTATVAFRTRVKPGKFVQELPYGVLERPLNKLYQPTFWAVKNWIDLVDVSGEFGVNLALTAPAVVHADKDGFLEMIVLRNARLEKVNGIPVLAFPARGKDPAQHTIEYGFWAHGSEDWLKRAVYSQAKVLLSPAEQKAEIDNLDALISQSVKLDRNDVIITALKKAESGNGIILRLFRYQPAPVSVRLALLGKSIKQAFLADALERILKPLPIKDGKVELEMNYSLATVLIQC